MQPTPTTRSPERHIPILLEEYRALYGLATLRLDALERRSPIIGAALTGVLSGVSSIEPMAQLILLLALPPSVLWYLSGTINHARSFEDALRSIERIEMAVNSLIGDELLRFQSRHPSRGRRVGGRTGTVAVWSVVAASTAILIGCAALYRALDLPWLQMYAVGIMSSAAVGAWQVIGYHRYRFREQGGIVR